MVLTLKPFGTYKDYIREPFMRGDMRYISTSTIREIDVLR